MSRKTSMTALARWSFWFGAALRHRRIDSASGMCHDGFRPYGLLLRIPHGSRVVDRLPVADRLPYFLRCEREIEMAHAEGVERLHHGIRDRRRRADGSGLADVLDAQRVGGQGGDGAAQRMV